MGLLALNDNIMPKTRNVPIISHCNPVAPGGHEQPPFVQFPPFKHQ